MLLTCPCSADAIPLWLVICFTVSVAAAAALALLVPPLGRIF